MSIILFLYKFLFFSVINVFLFGCNIDSCTDNSGISYIDSFQKSSFKSDTYIYSPKNCLYKVKFPKKPVISIGYSVDHKNITSETAELIIHSDTSLIRTELIFLNNQVIDKEQQKKILENYAFANGLSNAGIFESKTKFGNCINLRGYKTLKVETGDIIPVTYTAECYFNKGFIFVLYAGCPSKNYPPPLAQVCRAGLKRGVLVPCNIFQN